MILFPNCKINLGLHVIAKRNDGFHDIDTLFYPIPFYDALEAVRSTEPGGIQFSMTGADVEIPVEKNLCVKSYNLLSTRFGKIPPVKMHLHKSLPTGSGLGGGSSDGAHALLLLNSLLNLQLEENELSELALLLGSDCPFFIRNTPSIGGGRGEHLRFFPLDLSPYLLVLVHPRIHVNTAWAFSRITPDAERPTISELLSQPVEKWKNSLVNDFETAVFGAYEEIGKVKETLYAAGALYASLSGSGSAVYGLFPKTENPVLEFPGHYLVKHLNLPG